LFCQAEDGGFHGLEGVVHGDQYRGARIFEVSWNAASISGRHAIYLSIHKCSEILSKSSCLRKVCIWNMTWSISEVLVSMNPTSQSRELIRELIRCQILKVVSILRRS
jgi:hypothetical protein